MHDPGSVYRGGMVEARLNTAKSRVRGELHARAAWLRALALGLTLIVPACAYKPSVPPSEAHLTPESIAPAGEKESILPPVTSSTYVPPPKTRAKAPTYSVVVHEVPVKELLLALARDTKENIDIHPGLQGLVSLNAIDETLLAILERVSKQVNLRYRIEGKTIIVSPDTPYLKTYKVDYVNMSRDTASTIAVSGQITSGGGGVGQIGGGTSSTSVTTTSKNNFWDLLQANVRSILSSTRALSQSAEDRQARAEAAKAARDERLAQAEAVARAGQHAANLFQTAFESSTSPAAADLSQDLVINQIAGTVSVMATERQHQLLQQYFDAISASSQRQVLIEATIAEVTLFNNYQAGVDWSRLAFNGGGFTFSQLLTGTVGGGASPPTGLTVGYTNNTSNTGNVSATVKLLEQFGNTRVLSSPKLMAMNNQTALLKVVDNVVYFQIQSSVSQGTGGSSNLQSITTTAQTVAVGFIMSMTPQVNDSGVVTLTVRPTITRVQRFVEDPNPLLKIGPDGSPLASPLSNPVPQVQVREMESVLQLVSGQTAILGGLMQDDVARNTDQIPGVGNIPRVGEAFKFRNDKVTKTELVIFIRPVVVNNPSLDSDDLKHLRKFLPEIDKTGLTP
jgi:MSHA type pilus biogenesis protein MshL